ncbi:MAG TPA: hypothetical protein VMU85_20965 [Stellaceae bacterium]|nr:hypothetical protein [Stellaceae bacterium]
MTVGSGLSKTDPARSRRVAAICAAAVVLAGLSGCVIAPYPGPGYYHRDHYYWHDDYYRGGYYR